MGGGMIGWASAPYDPLWQRRHPKRAAWMSLAGPAANFTLMLLAALAIHIGIMTGAFSSPTSANFTTVAVAAKGASEAASGFATFFSILFSLNLLLGTFNLLPIPPLDGYSVLGLFTSEATAVKMEDLRQQARMFSFLGLVVGWQIFSQLYDP